MKILTKNQVIALQKQLIDRYCGTYGVRDEGILDSALHAPFQTFSGEELYPDIFEKAARLGFGLIKGHAFIDGNKRIGTHVMLIFLRLNDVMLRYSDDELIQMIFDVASGSADDKALLNWLKDHTE